MHARSLPDTLKTLLPPLPSGDLGADACPLERALLVGASLVELVHLPRRSGAGSFGAWSLRPVCAGEVAAGAAATGPAHAAPKERSDPMLPSFVPTEAGWSCAVPPGWEVWLEDRSGPRVPDGVGMCGPEDAQGSVHVLRHVGEQLVLRAGPRTVVARPVPPVPRVPSPAPGLEHPLAGLLSLALALLVLFGALLARPDSPPSLARATVDDRHVEYLLEPLLTQSPVRASVFGGVQPRGGRSPWDTAPEAPPTSPPEKDPGGSTSWLLEGPGHLYIVHESGPSGIPGLEPAFGPTRVGDPSRPRPLAALLRLPADAEIDARGALEPSVPAAVVRSNLARLRYCVIRGRLRTPDLSGRLTLRFWIEPDGSVARAEARSSTLRDAAVTDCIVRSFRRMLFPSHAGRAPIRVDYPLVIDAR